MKALSFYFFICFYLLFCPTCIVALHEVMEQIEQFLETYSHDGVKYKYAGSYAPPTFGIIDNGDGTYSASFEGTDYKSLRIDVSPRG